MKFKNLKAGRVFYPLEEEGKETDASLMTFVKLGKRSFAARLPDRLLVQFGEDEKVFVAR